MHGMHACMHACNVMHACMHALHTHVSVWRDSGRDEEVSAALFPAWALSTDDRAPAVYRAAKIASTMCAPAYRSNSDHAC